MTNYKLNKGFIVQRTGKSMTIFDPEESVMYTFNETAAYMFTLFKRNKSLAEIIELTSTKFDTNKNIIKKDLGTFIEKLLHEKIITEE